jgi:cell division protein ZapA
MCALQFASKIEQGGLERSEHKDEALQRLRALDDLLHSKLGE